MRRIDAELPDPLPQAAPPIRREAAVDTSNWPVLAIVGRPNVGKSTLFNRLTSSRRSIVGDEPGITRDRIYGEIEWAGQHARVVDTGGILPDDPELIPSEIFRQARVALDEADSIVMVVDGRTPLAAPDYDLARLLLRGGKPLLLAVNKIDTERMEEQTAEYRRLGIREVLPISAEHGVGIGDLLDHVFATLTFPEAKSSVEAAPEAEPEEEEGSRTTEPTASSSSTRPPSPSSAAPTSARARCSTSSPALRAPSSPPSPAPRAMLSMRSSNTTAACCALSTPPASGARAKPK